VWRGKVYELTDCIKKSNVECVIQPVKSSAIDGSKVVAQGTTVSRDRMTP
jgi:alcohol dehydrogenase YqhD (iron-dependent ADH family)